MAINSAGQPPLLSFDAGIERIIQGSGDGVKLPERNALPPSGQQLQLQLDKILQAPSLDQALQALLQPTIDDPSLLTPGRYQTVLDGAAATLQNLSASCGDWPAGPSAELLQQAVAVLSEERELRQLLTTYRNILVQG